MPTADQPTLQTTVELPPLSRLATITPASIDEETRTVEVTFTTGAAVKRFDWRTGELFLEKLSLKPEHVRLDRLNAGAPVLDSHSGWRLANQLGVVDEASIDGKRGRATLRMSQRPEVDGTWLDIKTKVVRNVSVGYEVHAYQDVPQKDDSKLRTRIAVDWEPYEISFVPMPADMHAQTRDGKRQDIRTHTAVIVTRSEETPMPETQVQQPSAERQPSEYLVEQPIGQSPQQRAAAPAAAAAEPNDRDLGATQERERVQGILTATRAARLPQAFADRLIADPAMTLVRAQSAVFAEMNGREPDLPIRGGQPEITLVDGGPLVHQRAGIENALLHRAAPAMFALDDKGREYRGLSMLRIAEIYLNSRGVRTTTMNPDTISRMALGLDTRAGLHTTSDFANLLADVANKILRQAYEAAPQTFQPISRQRTASDFKQINLVQLGEAPALLEVLEHGEFTRGTIGDAKEPFRLKTYGRVFGITRQALINDDVDAFSRVPMLFGRSARNLESDVIWGLITANAAMQDTFAIFSTQHANLQADGDVISIDSLSRARQAIRLQTGLDGVTMLNLTPRYLIVPPSLETVAQQYVTLTIQAIEAINGNPFAGTMQVIVEPRLEANSSTAWYMAASQDQIDMVIYAYLEGQSGPAIEQRLGFDIDGLEIKARHDFGAVVADFRGLHKDPGEGVS